MTLVTDASPFFHIEDFAVSKSYPQLVEPVPPDYRKNVERLVIGVLHPLRVELDMSLVVLSGYRSRALNAALRGSPTSQHRVAQAADITCRFPELLFRAAMRMAAQLDLGQCIYYPDQRFIHFATPSPRFPRPTFQLHKPAAGFKYEPIEGEEELTERLAA
jgi:hypothetical protein